MGSARRGGDKSHHLPCLSSPCPTSQSPVVCTAADSQSLFHFRAVGSSAVSVLASQLQFECSSWVGFLCTLAMTPWWAVCRVSLSRVWGEMACVCAVCHERGNPNNIPEGEGLSEWRWKRKSVFDDNYLAWVYLVLHSILYIHRCKSRVLFSLCYLGLAIGNNTSPLGNCHWLRDSTWFRSTRVLETHCTDLHSRLAQASLSYLIPSSLHPSFLSSLHPWPLSLSFTRWILKLKHYTSHTNTVVLSWTSSSHRPSFDQWEQLFLV